MFTTHNRKLKSLSGQKLGHAMSKISNFWCLVIEMSSDSRSRDQNIFSWDQTLYLSDHTSKVLYFFYQELADNKQIFGIGKKSVISEIIWLISYWWIKIWNLFQKWDPNLFEMIVNVFNIFLWEELFFKELSRVNSLESESVHSM